MYFPVSGVDVFPLWPPIVAFIVSLFTSMGGISGAFLLLPFQVSVLHFTSPAVTPTNLVFNIVAIPSGVYRYIKEGRMTWPLTWVIIVGTLPGVFIGAILRIKYLPNPKVFKLFVGCVLLYLGIRILYQLIDKTEKHRKHEDKVLEEKTGKHRGVASEARVKIVRFSLKRITYRFYNETFSFNVMGLTTLSFITGTIGGTYGIGGGAIIAPLLITFFGLPVYTIAGSTLMATLLTSMAGVTFYQLIAPMYANAGLAIAPDWPLGFLFGIGGLIGMYCGARMQKFVPAKYIKVLLTFIILFLSGRYIFQFFW